MSTPLADHLRLFAMDAITELAELKDVLPLISPSLLAADLANLEREIHRLEVGRRAGVLHLDVMDGHFVPNLSFGLPVVEAVRRVTGLAAGRPPDDLRPGPLRRGFRQAGADLLTFHVEAVDDPAALLDRVRRPGGGGRVASARPRPSAAGTVPRSLRLVLLMSVIPGLGGSTSHPERLRRPVGSVKGGPSRRAVDRRRGQHGYDWPCAEAGVEWFVVGTALLGHPDYRLRMAELASAARQSPPCLTRVLYGSHCVDSSGHDGLRRTAADPGNLDMPLNSQGASEVAQMIEELRGLGMEVVYAPAASRPCKRPRPSPRAWTSSSASSTAWKT